MEPDKEMEGRRVIEAHLTRSIIFAKDMVKMTRFYRDVLGLVPQPGEEPPEEWLAFDAGPTQLALHAIPPGAAAQVQIASPPAARWSAPTKLVFLVEDLEQARDALVSHGVQLVDNPYQNPPGKFVRCDFLDPEGNIFQLTVIEKR